MIIQQPAQQLPPVTIKTLLKLRVREPGSVRPVQGSRSATRTAPGSRKRSATSRSPREPRCRSRLRLHHHYQPARQAGLHRPRRKVRHNGCRDRRSRWPPPWSTLDMSNADFDTRHTSPRPGPTAAKAPPNRLKTPARGRPNGSTPGNRHQQTAQTATPPPGRQPKTPYLQAIHRQFSPPEGPFRRAAPRLGGAALLK